MHISRTFQSILSPARLLMIAGAALGLAAFANVHPAGASAMMTATPTDVVIPAGQSTGQTFISWNTGTNQGGQVWVSVDGAAEVDQIPNAQPSGGTTLQVSVGHTYTFRHYVGQKSGQPAAASVTVKAHHPKADLTVKYDGFISGKMRYTVKNGGGTPTGSFRVAVLEGADSYGFYAASLAAGQSRQYEIPSALNGCGRSIAILVDTEHVVDESVENNNGTGFNAVCLID